MMMMMMHKQDQYRTKLYRNHHQMCPIRQDQVQFCCHTSTSQKRFRHAEINWICLGIARISIHVHVQAPQLEKKYPMWVMRINDFLSLSKFPSHLELKSSGIPHIHEAHFFTLFVSHRWLGCSCIL